MELLVVVAIMSLLSVAAVPAFTTIQQGNRMGNATTVVATLVEQARAYAMAKNTYVFVGFAETDVSQPVTQAQSGGIGRVAAQVFVSADGTESLDASNVQPVGKMALFDHLNLPSSLPAAGAMTRPTADYVVGDGGFPLASSTIQSGRFSFSKVIEFDPQGVAHLPSAPRSAGAIQYLEVDLQPVQGNAAPAAETKDHAAVQIDGLTGVVSIYRP